MTRLSATIPRVATVTSMITAFDDYPVHQTSKPVAHTVSGDPNHYDRYFFNGYDAEGRIFFAAAMGLYPNRHVMDASFCVIVDGKEQINVHASGRAPYDRADCLAVGPVTISIIEPLRVLKVQVDAPDHGVVADITFHATSAACEEPPFYMRSGSRVTTDYTRLTQLGNWSGSLTVDGRTVTLDPATHLGCRDRSWGVRNVGERMQLGAPLNLPPQFFWLWAPVNFGSFGTLFDVNEYEDGTFWHRSGTLLSGVDGQSHARNVSYGMAWEKGTRRSAGFTLDMDFPGESIRLEFEPVLHFQMFGLGYLHPEWGHGFWKGESATGSERMLLPVQDPTAPHHIHVQTLSRVTATRGDGSVHVGTGVLESLVLGAHVPSGFEGVADGHQG
mgnify:FL=1